MTRRRLAQIAAPLSVAGALVLGWRAGLPSEAVRGQVRLAPGVQAAHARPVASPAPDLAGVARVPGAMRPDGPVGPVEPAGPESHSESAHDLHALFMRHSRSADPRALEEARLALANCTDHARQADALKMAFAGGDPGPLLGPLTPGRQLASAELDRRCRGFGQMAPAVLAAMQADLQARLHALGSRLADGPRQASSLQEPAEVARLLGAGTATAFEQARPALVAALARQAGVAQESPAWEDLETAMLLASCELGRDCSAGAFESLRRCTWQARCGQGLFDHWQEGLPATRVEAISNTRNRVLRVIRSGQAAALVWP
ncbi:MAG: hypothetical protein KF796_09405 [Ramlibacter sp.]|nr:hypothetical protein [Ramlibacter sp.]